MAAEQPAAQPPHPDEDRHGPHPSTEEPSAAPMFRDEALDVLMRRLDDAPWATLNVRSDSGHYQAVYIEYDAEGGAQSFPGECRMNLTDALSSLAEKLS
jgi:hypothetical protein